MSYNESSCDFHVNRVEFLFFYLKNENVLNLWQRFDLFSMYDDKWALINFRKLNRGLGKETKIKVEQKIIFLIANRIKIEWKCTFEKKRKKKKYNEIDDFVLFWREKKGKNNS